jgi:AcrR family transcriptional regulator
MAQVLKDDVRSAIRAAALPAFAARGFAGASMAEIADAAGISTGNLYRYFSSKEALFDDLLPGSLARQLGALVRARVGALAGVEDVDRLPPRARFHAASDELLTFAIQHRWQLVILLGRAEGTVHEAFADQLIAELEKLAVQHFRALDPCLVIHEPTRLALRLVYRNLVRTIVAVLNDHHDAGVMGEVIQAYGAYHLAGLRRMIRGAAR